MKATDKVKAAKALLVDLLQFQVRTKEDGEVPVFSEASLYDALGKDAARSVRGRVQRLAEMLGVRDMDLVARGQEETEFIDKNRMRLWVVEDGVERAFSALRMLRFAVQDLERSREFAEAAGSAREEVQQAVSSVEYSTPKAVLRRVLCALGVDLKTGRMLSKWERGKSKDESVS